MNQNQEEVPVEQDHEAASAVLAALHPSRPDQWRREITAIVTAHRIAAHNEGKREGLEEAVRIAERHEVDESDFGTVSRWAAGFDAAALDIKNAIRAKLAPEHQQGEDR